MNSKYAVVSNVHRFNTKEFEKVVTGELAIHMRGCVVSNLNENVPQDQEFDEKCPGGALFTTMCLLEFYPCCTLFKGQLALKPNFGGMTRCFPPTETSIFMKLLHRLNSSYAQCGDHQVLLMDGPN